jgi:hypothetical protein
LWTIQAVADELQFYYGTTGPIYQFQDDGLIYTNNNKLSPFASISTKSSAYTLTASDVNTVIGVSGTTQITIPQGLTIGYQTTVLRTGTGIITIKGATGVTVNGTSAGEKEITTQYNAVTIVCNSSNNFWVVG